MEGRVSYIDRLLSLVEELLTVAQRLEESCGDDSCRLVVAIVRDAAYKVRKEVRAREGSLRALESKKPPKGA